MGPPEAWNDPGEPLQRFRLREGLILGLNVLVTAVMLGLQLAVFPWDQPATRRVSAVLAVFLALQLAGLVAIVRLARPLEGARLRLYLEASVWSVVACAALTEVLRGSSESHYPVMLVPPIVAAAFRSSRTGLAAVLATSAALPLAACLLYFRAHPPLELDELAEATTVAVIFLLMGLVTRVLAEALQREKLRLARSLAELSATRDRLVREEKLSAVGRLSGSIAHEIRNPVAMIASSLALAGRDGAAADVRAQMFEIAGREARRLEKLTDDFLAYARTAPPERRPVPLAAVLEHVASLSRARAAERGVTVAADFAGGTVGDATVAIDAYQVQQALLNLVLNGIDATAPGGEVRVHGALDGALLRLSVENTGAPVDGTAAERMFEPFFTTKPGGTGLGLAIVRNIARAHGGDVALTCNEAGRVRFTIEIPAAAVSAARPGAGHGARADR